MHLDCRQPLSPLVGITRPLYHRPPSATHVLSSTRQSPPTAAKSVPRATPSTSAGVKLRGDNAGTARPRAPWPRSTDTAAVTVTRMDRL